jgi:DNA-directed RNA polymerase subunit RPC12/RpoP
MAGQHDDTEVRIQCPGCGDVTVDTLATLRADKSVFCLGCGVQILVDLRNHPILQLERFEDWARSQVADNDNV